MIKYEWRTDWSSDESSELADLLQRAAEFDAEPEYSGIDFADVERAMGQPDPPVRHLFIWMLPHATAMGQPDEPERIAGILRLSSDSSDAAEATVVIDPRLRSRGIMTLLLEQVGVDASLPDGWMGTGAHTVTAWARGSHPATGRLSNRFLIARTRRVWKLIRSTDSAEAACAAPVLDQVSASALDDIGWASPLAGGSDLHALRESGSVAGAVALDLRAVDSEEFGRCGTLRQAVTAPNSDTKGLRRLLDGAAAVAHDAGLTGLICHVDSDNASLVNACRLTGFQHDRTDVRFQLGGRA
jgi:GNAT superfamily N-acetyltransferase